jgi:hypothetical protein
MEYASLGFRIGFALGDRLGRLRCVDQPLVIWRPSPHYITRRLDLAALLDSDLARGLLVYGDQAACGSGPVDMHPA